MNDMTYFDQQATIDPFFIIAGSTDDDFCSDLLHITTLPMELHHHLRSLGYDAVIDFSYGGIHLYDMHSSFVLQHLRRPTEAEMRALEEADPDAPAPAQPPQQGMIRRRVNNAERTAASTSFSLNYGALAPVEAWQRLRVLLAHRELRTAIIFSNLHLLQSSFTQQMLDVLAALSNSRDESHSIAVFIAKDSSLSCLEKTIMEGTPDWRIFARTYLLPRVAPGENRNADHPHYIHIGPPNAREIRSYLTARRLRADAALAVDHAEMEDACIEMAALCAEQERTLSSLGQAISQYREQHEHMIVNVRSAIGMLGGAKYRTAQEELDRLIGMKPLKDFIRSWRTLHRWTAESERRMPRHASRICPSPTKPVVRGHALNIVLTGDSGTGKSTAAALIGKLYHEAGVLPSRRCVTVSAENLISANVGQSAGQLHAYVEQAMGGVLVIDEAYALMDNMHGQDVLDALTNVTSRYAGQIAVILAGYREPMERLLKANRGLPRRFPNQIHLEAYSAQELQEIFLLMASDDESVQIGATLHEVLPVFFQNWVDARDSLTWGNAGEAETLLGTMRKSCAARQEQEHSSARKLILEAADIPLHLQGFLKPRSQSLQEALDKINSMIGLEGVKAFLRALADKMVLQGAGGNCGAFIFEGPPGTGKSLIGSSLCDMMYQLGVLKRCHPVVYSARELLAPPKHSTKPGQIAPTTGNSLQEALRRAKGGLLFIDEAHQLADTEEGRALVREMVPLIDRAEFRTTTCLVLACYSTHKARLLAIDPGLNSRFPASNHIPFNHYRPHELVAIMKGIAAEMHETLSDDFCARTEYALSRHLVTPQPNFGNGRYMRDTYLPDAVKARNQRLRKELGLSKESSITAEAAAALPPEARCTLTGSDLPPLFQRLAGPVDAKLPPIVSGTQMLDELIEKDDFVRFIKGMTAQDSIDDSFGLHYILTGPRGSGRHTAICAAAHAMYEAGLLRSSEVAFLSKSMLEGQHVGSTAPKTRAAMQAGRGGTVVIEYPSSLLPRNSYESSFGPDALGEIAACAGEMSGDTSVVFLDTEEGMEALLKAYPSFQSQMNQQFTFYDLSGDAMYRLLRLQTAHKLIFADDVEPLLEDVIVNWVNDRGGDSNLKAWNNGAALDRLLGDLKANHQRLHGEERKDADGYSCPVITRSMFPAQMQKYMKPASAVNTDAMNSLMHLTGLHAVKDRVRCIETKLRRTDPAKVMPGCFAFIGPSGVGKTTVALLLGGVMRSLGVLRSGHVITRNAREMAEQIDDFDAIIRMARGNVLFIDEAHNLAASNAGIAVIKRLLTVLEDTEIMKNLCIILAGYPNEMAHLFTVDRGLASRFGTEDAIVRFDPYTAEELTAILHDMASRADEISQIGSTVPLDLKNPASAEYVAGCRQIFDALVKGGNPDFGNARAVRNLLHDSVTSQIMRLDAQYGRDADIPAEELRILRREDISERWSRFIPDRLLDAKISGKLLTTGGSTPITDASLNSDVNRLAPSTMLLQVQTENGGQGEGTGFLISGEGHLLTAAHVVSGAASVRARLSYPGMPGGPRWFDCDVLQPVRTDIDMALLKVRGGSGFTPMPLRAASTPLSPSEQTLIIGYPFGSRLSTSADALLHSHFSGRIASIQQPGTIRERCFIDSSGKAGNSGSPVISRETGEVIGVFNASQTQRHSSGDLIEEINYFTPIRLFFEHFVTE